MHVSFEPNQEVGHMFASFSQDCVGLAAQNFGISLGVSRESVGEVERMAGEFHDQVQAARPEDVLAVARMLGGHIAHVLISVHGWVPGMASMGEEKMPGVQLAGRRTCWPWGKAHNRLTNGPEDNLWHYYLSLTDQLGPPIDLKDIA